MISKTVWNRVKVMNFEDVNQVIGKLYIDVFFLQFSQLFLRNNKNWKFSTTLSWKKNKSDMSENWWFDWILAA